MKGDKRFCGSAADHLSRAARLANTVRQNNGLEPVEDISAASRLREDLGFDSLDLAEFAVRVEREFGIDFFSSGMINTFGELLARMEAADE